MRLRILIAIPVLNEEKVLRGTVETVQRFVRESLSDFEVVIVIADNGSEDATSIIGQQLATSFANVRYCRVAARGKGIAIRTAWSLSDADVYVFMDADLATDLTAFPALIRHVQENGGVAVGSRYCKGATVERSMFRKALSFGYRVLLRCGLGTRITDAPCGFKAASADAVHAVLHHVKNDAWFFDTEFVIRAERLGLRVQEVPVVWRELRPRGRKSKVRIMKLISEYVHEVLRLRRDLSATNNEYVFVAIAAFVLVVLSSIPMVAALVFAHTHGIEWSGRIHLSPGDLAVYLSSIAQAAHGRIFFLNLATTEHLVPVPNVVWLLGGFLSAFFRIPSITAYHLLRILLVPVFVFVSWFALSYFVPSKTPRKIAFLLLLFGSGVGALIAPFLAFAPITARYAWPTDMWVGESNVFLSAMYSPHFLASWTLLVASLWMLSRAYEDIRYRTAVIAGLLALLLFQFHPFYAPTLYAVGAAWLVLAACRDGKALLLKRLTAYVIFVVLSLPVVVYYFWLAKFTMNGAVLIGSNILLTPLPLFVLAGFGGFALFAPFGRVEAVRTRGAVGRRANELAVWAIVTVLLLYAPLSFQRRLLEGVEFPLAALTGVALFAWNERRVVLSGYGRYGVSAASTVLFAVIFFLSSFYAVAAPISLFDTATGRAIFFFSKDQAAALAWIRKSTPRDALFLSGKDTGNDILGWGERRVYVGHWAATIDFESKQRDIAAFFSTMTSSAREDFLHMNHIAYVYHGPTERNFGGSFDDDAELTPVFLNGEVTIYKVRR